MGNEGASLDPLETSERLADRRKIGPIGVLADRCGPSGVVQPQQIAARDGPVTASAAAPCCVIVALTGGRFL